MYLAVSRAIFIFWLPAACARTRSPSASTAAWPRLPGPHLSAGNETMRRVLRSRLIGAAARLI